LIVFRRALETAAPQIASLADRIVSSGDPAKRVEHYEAMPAISIDYALMEKAPNVAAIRGDFGWSDVGSFEALERVGVPVAELLKKAPSLLSASRIVAEHSFPPDEEGIACQRLETWPQDALASGEPSGALCWHRSLHERYLDASPRSICYASGRRRSPGDGADRRVASERWARNLAEAVMKSSRIWACRSACGSTRMGGWSHRRSRRAAFCRTTAWKKRACRSPGNSS